MNRRSVPSLATIDAYWDDDEPPTEPRIEAPPTLRAAYQFVEDDREETEP